MNKLNFMPYRYLEENYKKRKSLICISSIVNIILIIILFWIFIFNTTKLNNLQKEEHIVKEKIEEIVSKEKNKNNKLQKQNKIISEITSNINTFRNLKIENDILWIEGNYSDSNSYKDIVIFLEKEYGLKIITLQSPIKKEEDYIYRVGVSINGK
ncbi:hypothetical protein BD780_002217 [Clostridium tetanomorphum]|uniref:Uncharacterized protein n=1 Tax=Clostridium tetanomorphum TaxID=1553 RepID=A0A923E8D2_CLOTT|nr:hypothetical protein [Clostridium tetanomorphum]KAJ51493.1 hypothetical protein CTM_12925 [Clostridium tetanomorphum DSM 665]MBC2396586.1 hypothetical protein [Clostridium tetanomorphum]MBP1863914.1 hypothetical protein [Clostridium tetanomorphum]NRS84992.1 hypothetical protein [Clostridium tetanomorphum]NRZ98208.1 hypothetical protein [Clostridium tetanomorphum]